MCQQGTLLFENDISKLNGKKICLCNTFFRDIWLLLVLQDYELLAAQLDGAKTDLAKKVNNITKAAANKDIVEAAEEHAKNLTELAKELEE